MEAEQAVNKIRLMFGIGNNMVQGFSLVYEAEDGSAGSLNVWYEDVLFRKVRFIDDGDSIVVWRKKTKTFGKVIWVVDQINIRRDFQIKNQIIAKE